MITHHINSSYLSILFLQKVNVMIGVMWREFTHAWIDSLLVYDATISKLFYKSKKKNLFEWKNESRKFNWKLNKVKYMRTVYTIQLDYNVYAVHSHST